MGITVLTLDTARCGVSIGGSRPVEAVRCSPPRSFFVFFFFFFTSARFLSLVCEIQTSPNTIALDITQLK